MSDLKTDYPELAVLFSGLQDGIQSNHRLGTSNTLSSSLGKDIAYVASFHGATMTDIAAGLRMVADAIDPPPMVQVNRDIAEMLSRPIKRARRMEQPDA